MSKESPLVNDIIENSLFAKNWQTKARNQYLLEEFFELTKESLSQITPYDPSRYYFYVLRMPPIFESGADSKMSDLFRAFAKLLCSYSTAISGFQATTMETADQQMRTEFQDVAHAQRQTGAIKSLTFTLPSELTGNIITRTLGLWMDAIADKYTSVASYLGSDLTYGAGNHSMVGFVLKPNPNLTVNEYSAICYNMYPKNNPTDIHESRFRDGSFQELSLEFNVNVLADNLLVRELGNKLMTNLKNDLIANSTTYDVLEATNLTPL
ncbi:MAG: hypothetical protein ACRCX2_20320 [Paraclostridium sp.]